MEEKENRYLYDLEKVPLKSEREENSRRRKKNFLYFLICLLFFTAGFFVSYFIYNRVHPTVETDKQDTLGEIEYAMENYWLYGDDHENLKEELEDKALKGMTEFDFDPYTSYMSRQEMLDMASGINHNYVGIGVEYSTSSGMPTVTRVMKNSPAERAGILSGDIILSVDGTSIEDLDTSEIRALVVGEEGTEVLIGIMRGNKQLEIPVIRGAINNTAYATMMDDDIVYLAIDSFGDTTASEIASYLDDYTSYHKIIIDIRGNGGGYQNSIREVLGLFMGPNRIYLLQEDKNGNVLADYTQSTKTFANFDSICVLINENTASAAEVFALVIREQCDNVTLIGNTTYGKGVIQTNQSLRNGGVLKLTRYYWYSPNGVSINDVGVVPDIQVDMPEIYYSIFYLMEDDEKYEIDSVSEKVATGQLALKFLGYDVKRTDGYFDQSTADALIRFKGENGLPAIASYDSDTNEMLYAVVSSTLANDESNDYQLLKAKEVVNGDQH